MTDDDHAICQSLFILHEIKVGPSLLMVKKKNQMLENVALLETRALRYLAGYADWESPKELLQALNDAVAVVSSHVPARHTGPGNPGKRETSPEDEAIIAKHIETGAKIGTLVRLAGGTDEDRRRIKREVDRRNERSPIEN